MKLLFAALLYVISATLYGSVVGHTSNMDTSVGIMKRVTPQVLDEIQSDDLNHAGNIPPDDALLNGTHMPYQA